MLEICSFISMTRCCWHDKSELPTIDCYIIAEFELQIFWHGYTEFITNIHIAFISMQVKSRTNLILFEIKGVQYNNIHPTGFIAFVNPD